MKRSTPESRPIAQLFDELRFGADRTLNLRALFPSAQDARVQCEQWLRQKQIEGAKEVLVITGRGRGSYDGVGVVREAIAALMPSLRRRNVVSHVTEHTAGSFVVTLASVRALFETPRRRRERATPAVPFFAPLAALEPGTIALLRELAQLQLHSLGVRHADEGVVNEEMLRQFTALSPALGDARDAEARLQQAVLRAIEELDHR